MDNIFVLVSKRNTTIRTALNKTGITTKMKITKNTVRELSKIMRVGFKMENPRSKKHQFNPMIQQPINK